MYVVDLGSLYCPRCDSAGPGLAGSSQRGIHWHECSRCGWYRVLSTDQAVAIQALAASGAVAA